MGIRYKNKINIENISTYDLIKGIDFSIIDKKSIKKIDIIKSLEKSGIDLDYNNVAEHRNCILSRIRKECKYYYGHYGDERFNESLVVTTYNIFVSIEFFNRLTRFLNLHFHTKLQKININDKIY